MAKQLKLQHSESVVAHAASRIYAAYIGASRVEEGQEKEWMIRSLREAIQLCAAADDMIISDDELVGSAAKNAAGIPTAS